MKWLKHKLIYFLARKLLPLVEPKDIISFVKTTAFINREKISDVELKSLKEEARFLDESRLWKLMNNYFEELAQRKMFVKSSDITDLIFGKTMLYTLDVQRKVKDNILNAKR